MTITVNELTLDELKTKHQTMWGLGDYAAVAEQVVPHVGPAAVDAAGLQPGDRVLDVAAGSGNATLPAAATGAQVVACDIVPSLLERGRAAAAAVGLDNISWELGDAENLPYADGEFDAVLSTLGVMFAPHHQVAADELLRVCRPGGTIALVSWTPAGFIGQMFAAMRPFVPPPPPGVQPAPLWGDPEHVRSLFGDRVTDFTAEKRTLPVDRFASAEEFRDYFKANYGPTIAAYRTLGGDAAKVEALDLALADLGRRFDLSDDAASVRFEWEYLLVTARRAA